MSITGSIQSIPRTVVSGYFKTARLPLNAASKIAGRDVEQWAPALAFEGFEAGIEAALGKALGDRVLLERGEVRRARVAELRKAVEFEAAANGLSEQSRDEFEQRRAAADGRRRKAAQQAKKRASEAERKAELREERVEKQTDAKVRAAKQAEQAQAEAIARQERQGRLAVLEEEESALESAKKAADAEDTAAVIEDTIQGSTEARKTG